MADRAAVRVIDRAWVESAAASHLARYATTRAHLTSLLVRRVRRAALKGAVVVEDLDAVVASVLDRHVALGTLDEAAWAEARARTLTRRGVASGVVHQRLRQKGVADPRAALAAVAEELRDEEGGSTLDPNLLAACAWARRRRVGAFARERTAGIDRKALGSMGRAGFSFAIAHRVLGMSLDEADEILIKLS